MCRVYIGAQMYSHDFVPFTPDAEKFLMELETGASTFNRAKWGGPILKDSFGTFLAYQRDTSLSPALQADSPSMGTDAPSSSLFRQLEILISDMESGREMDKEKVMMLKIRQERKDDQSFAQGSLTAVLMELLRKAERPATMVNDTMTGSKVLSSDPGRSPPTADYWCCCACKDESSLSQRKCPSCLHRRCMHCKVVLDLNSQAWDKRSAMIADKWYCCHCKDGGHSLKVVVGCPLCAHRRCTHCRVVGAWSLNRTTWSESERKQLFPK